ncbi:hypothetical protein [Metasolibacillus meyeri]|uniref:hypothetical protein n=1 Tax=Metasolibacillus meyeri TaxID=1071052 RepID=UPI000D2F8F6B|nr:hypothetical protein [Metasolibacillus meyeri]
MLKVNGSAITKGPYTVCLPLDEAVYEAMSTEEARVLISEAIKSQTHRDVQVSHVNIYDYEEVEEINALQAINHYLVQGERVDGVLHHIVTSEINRLQEMLEGNDGMSVREIRAQFVDLHRQLLASQNEKLRKALAGESND